MKIKHSNADIMKLHGLKKQKLYFCKWYTDGKYIYFASKYGFNKFKRLEWVTL